MAFGELADYVMEHGERVDDTFDMHMPLGNGMLHATYHMGRQYEDSITIAVREPRATLSIDIAGPFLKQYTRTSSTEHYQADHIDFSTASLMEAVQEAFEGRPQGFLRQYDHLMSL